MKHFGKIIIVFNNFCKKFHLNSLRGSEYVSDFKYGCFRYGCFLNIPRFRVYQVSANTSFAQGSACG